MLGGNGNGGAPAWRGPMLNCERVGIRLEPTRLRPRHAATLSISSAWSRLKVGVYGMVTKAGACQSILPTVGGSLPATFKAPYSQRDIDVFGITS
jgi:hypothetical protein